MITRFSNEEEGQALVDYAIVIALISLVMIISVMVLRKPVETVLTSHNAPFSTATSGHSGAPRNAPAAPPNSLAVTVAFTILWAIVSFFCGFFVFLKLTGEAAVSGEVKESLDHEDDSRP